MKTAESILIGALVIAGLGTGAWFLTRDSAAGAALESGGSGPSARAESQPGPRPQTPATPPTASRRMEAAAAPREELLQGFAGIVVDPQGVPIPGVHVSLVHGLQISNLFQLLQSRRRDALAKVESAIDTDQAGRFKLPCNVYSQEQPFELRAEHARCVAVGRMSELRVAEGVWRDVGRITMKPGNIVQGRVTVAGSGAPVPGARVALRQGSGVYQLKLPGAEGGNETQVDATGSYRFEDVEVGSVDLEATAKGFALVVRSQVLVAEGRGPTVVDFELPKGLEIAGVVVDAQGAPVARAAVTAEAISTKSPLVVTRFTDNDGAFELLGLGEGSYFLSAEAEGFVKAERKGPIAAGERHAQIVMEKQGGVRVFVAGRNGQALRRFTVEVKKYLASQPDSFGKVPDKHPIEVRNAPNGMCLIEGLDPDSYVLQVEAPEHAKKYSEPFTLVAGGEPPEVRVQLSQGGAIIGQVVGGDGRPLAGAEITTRPNNLEENPFVVMILPMIPMRITVAQVTTGADGRFRLPLLIPDAYQLRINHAEHFRINQKDVQVLEGQTTDLGVIKLSAGARVHGMVYVNGQPQGGVEVSIQGAANGGPLGYYADKALSDEQGRFRIATPLPPGNYEASAKRTNRPNPFDAIVDLKRSQKTITLYEGGANPGVILELNDAR